MIFGILGMVAFNLVDTFYVGQLGTAPLAAISFTFPVILMLNSLSMGLGVGASAVISRAIGEGDPYKVKRLTTDSLVLALLVVVAFVALGLLTINPLFQALGARGEILALTRQYMLIWYLGMPFVVIPMVGNNAIRATGDTKTPSAIMMTAVVVNMVMDPLLIFGLGPFPRMELAGAALATVLARATTLGVSFWVLYHREKMITFSPPALSEVLASWRQILYIGLPTAATNMIIPVAAGIVTRLLASFGPETVAGYGVASRIDMFALTVLMALGSVLGPFVGQNLGAGKFDRLRRGVSLSQRFALVWGGLMFLLLAVLARPVAGLFNDNPLVIDTIVLYLHIVPIGYGMQGMLMLSNTTLNVLNKPFYASGLIITQMFVLYVPLAYLASTMFGPAGIFSAAVTANLLAGLAAFLVLRRLLPAGAVRTPSQPYRVPAGGK
ncbi:MAG: MATE family efflux transporter [Chloroflexi bacterium]|nr:MAG: MATE family efflux transporter [Chloroflexota bacterium]